MSDIRQAGEALHIPGSDWALQTGTLTVPTTFLDRFEALEARMQRGGNTPDRRFIAAAVLSDEERSRPDSAVVRHARLLAAVNEVLRTEPDAPLLVAGEYYLHAAITARESGLGFQNNRAQGMSRPMGMVLCDGSVEVDVMNEAEPRVSIASRETGRHFTTFLLPDYVLTLTNLQETAEVVSKFPANQVLVAGREAVSGFFKTAMAPNQIGSEGAAQRRLLTEKIAEALDAETETLRPAPRAGQDT